jgi:hypothetical protein
VSAVYKISCAHAPLAFGLNFQKAQRCIAPASDEKALAVRFYNLAGRRTFMLACGFC